jgi:outer membrane autotransporter protein
VPLLARQMDLVTLGTFHQRQGDQMLLRGPGTAGAAGSFAGAGASAGANAFASLGGPVNAGAFAGAWGRIFGLELEQRFAGVLAPEFNGHMFGFQVGLDLAKFETGGHDDRFGVFAGHTRADGDVRGFALAIQRSLIGRLPLDSTSIGAYWTHIGPTDWYLDAVVMGSWFDAKPQSLRDIGANMDGQGITASIEAGYPFWVARWMSLEPQTQLIWQHTRFDPTSDPFTRLSFNLDDAVTGRAGLRLQGHFAGGSTLIQPYLQANLWHTFGGTDFAVFNDITALGTPFQGTTFEIGGGVVAKLSSHFGLHAQASYTTNVGGQFREALQGNVGVRITW